MVNRLMVSGKRGVKRDSFASLPRPTLFMLLAGTGAFLERPALRLVAIVLEIKSDIFI
jgi:hypothetical protein